MLALNISITILVREIKVVFSLIGAVTGNILGFILPGAMYLKIMIDRNKQKKSINHSSYLWIMAWVGVIFGFVSMVVCLTANVM